MNDSRYTRRFIAVPLLGLAMLTAACGDDDDSAVAGEQAADTAEVGGEQVGFCQAVFDLTAASDEDLGIDPEEASEEEMIAASRAWYGSEKAGELMDAATATAADELTDDVQTLVDGLREFSGTGDVDAAEAAIGDAQENVDAYLEAECPDLPVR